MIQYYDDYKQRVEVAKKRKSSIVPIIVILAIIFGMGMFSSCTTQQTLCDAYGTNHYYNKYHNTTSYGR
mgnify:CR=1 FL=1